MNFCFSENLFVAAGNRFKVLKIFISLKVTVHIYIYIYNTEDIINFFTE